MNEYLLKHPNTISSGSLKQFCKGADFKSWMVLFTLTNQKTLIARIKQKTKNPTEMQCVLINKCIHFKCHFAMKAPFNYSYLLKQKAESTSTYMCVYLVMYNHIMSQKALAGLKPTELCLCPFCFLCQSGSFFLFITELWKGNTEVVFSF